MQVTYKLKTFAKATFRILPGVLFFSLFPQFTFPSTSYTAPIELTPLIHDEPSALIMPAAIFATDDGKFAIIDAGSNSSRLKIYSCEGIFIKGQLPSYSTTGLTTQPLPGFNPFGPSAWSEGDGSIYLLETRLSGQTIKAISDNRNWEMQLPHENTYHLISNPSKAILFSNEGLADSKCETIMPLNLEGYDKVTIDDAGNIFALCIEGLGKFNRYGIPQWNRLFPEKPEGHFIPVTFAATGESIAVAGILLPPGVKAPEFRHNYESTLSANPSLPPEEIRHLFDNLEKSATPLLISYSTRDGKIGAGLELGGIPIYIDTNPAGDIYLLSYCAGQIMVSRIAPGFSDELPIFKLELGDKALSGTSKIAVSEGSIYYDRVKISYNANGEYQEKLTIERRRLNEKAAPVEYTAYPTYTGGYLVAGLAASHNDDVYCAGSKFSFTTAGKIIPGGVFLDAYGASGNHKLNFLAGTEPTLIPNALALHPDGGIILAAAYETVTLSKPWAMRFSSDGQLLKELSHLNKEGISEINMVAGGTIAVAPDGLMYQCDNIRPPDAGRAYMRIFDKEGSHLTDLVKFSLIGSGLLGIAGNEAILIWQDHYLLRVKSETIIAQANIGSRFADVDVLETCANGRLIYLLSSDGVIYTLPIDEGWDKKSYSLDDVEAAADVLRDSVMKHITTYGSPPGEIDYEFFSGQIGQADLDDALEVFFGPGPFDYRISGYGEFSFLLLGRDPYQSLLRVTRDGAELVL